MTAAQAVNNNCPVQDCVHPDDQTQPTFEMLKLLIKRFNQSEKRVHEDPQDLEIGEVGHLK